MFSVYYYFFLYVDLLLLNKFLLFVSNCLIRLSRIQLEMYFQFSSVPNVRDWDMLLGIQMLQLSCLLLFLTNQKPIFFISRLQGIFKLTDLISVTAEANINIIYGLKCTLHNKQLLRFLYCCVILLKSCVFNINKKKKQLNWLKFAKALGWQIRSCVFSPLTEYFITSNITKTLFFNFRFKQIIFLNKFFLNILNIL